jgi:uncharacterized cofD-like protein
VIPASRPRDAVVVVGGGHGCARSLAALRRLPVARTAVVSVADDGGSSGRLRRDLGVVALGDLRMALLALADAPTTSSSSVAALAGHRYSQGELAGHSLGNLMLVALLERHGGDLNAALEAFGALIGATGRVLPSTTEAVDLRAETEQGAVAGQAAVATATRIRTVHLSPSRPAAGPGVAAAIEAAQLVLLGPGSLFTSVLPNLLVPGVADALRATSARVVLVGNLREQPGETEGMDLSDHVAALLRHVPQLRIDVLLAHRAAVRDAHGLRSAVAGSVGRVDVASLGDPQDGHDPVLLATEVARLLEEDRGRNRVPAPAFDAG